MAEEQPQDMGVQGTSSEMRDPDSFKYSTDYHRFSSFLGVDRMKRGNRQLAQKVSTIYDWAKEQVGRDDHETIMFAVRDYQKGLGVNFSGETLVNHLFRNIRLDATGKIAKEKVKPKVVAKKKSKPVDIQATVQKKVAPAMKKIEKEVQRTVKKSINESVQRALEGALK